MATLGANTQDQPLFAVIQGKPRLKLEMKMTMDYSIFKRMKGNRDMEPKDLEALKRSYLINPIPKPVLLNEKMEVIDGQHTIEICRELGHHVYYYIVPGLTLKDVITLNQTSSKWKPKNYSASQIENGNKHYKTYEEFKTKWGFTHSTSLLLLSGGDQDRTVHADFTNGLFKVKNLEWAEAAAEKIYAIEPYYNGYKRTSFILALLFLFKKKEYKHSQFLHKLEILSYKMVHQPNMKMYVKMIEDIYNWKNQDKIRFSTL